MRAHRPRRPADLVGGGAWSSWRSPWPACSRPAAATTTTPTSSDTTASDDAAAAGASTGTDAYCDAALAIETAGEPDIDFETATEEEIAEATKTFAAETMRPLADDVLAAAPAELEADLQVQSDALDQVAETGDFSAFETPEVLAASEATHAYDLDDVRLDQPFAVDAADYSFAGLPDEMDAGVVSFELTNGGTEVHEMVLLRKNDGVTESFDELLALPEEEAMEKVTMVGLAGPVPPGEPALRRRRPGRGRVHGRLLHPGRHRQLRRPAPRGPAPHDAGHGPPAHGHLIGRHQRTHAPHSAVGPVNRGSRLSRWEARPSRASGPPKP